MSLKEDMQNDLNIFYDIEEFAIPAQYKGKNISVLEADEIEVFETEVKTISAMVKDFENIKLGDEIIVDGESFKINNFDFKPGSFKLEYNIGLIEVNDE